MLLLSTYPFGMMDVKSESINQSIMGLRCEGPSMAVSLGMLLQRQSLLALCSYVLPDVFPQLLSATSMHP
jgi:hypothetical protein